MPPITRTERLHVALMLTLTFSTGIIDATGYIGLDKVFTGNMTGNVVILGMGLLGQDRLPVIGPLVSLASYMVGAVIAGRVLRPVLDGWTGRCTTLFGIVGGVLGLAAVLSIPLSPGSIPLAVQYLVTGTLGVAMGIQAGAARHIAVQDVTTVVITSTITGLAGDSLLGGHRAQPWLRRALAVVLIAAGAVAGALLVHVHLALGMGVAALITIAVSVIGHRDAIAGSPAPANATAADTAVDGPADGDAAGGPVAA